MGILDVLFSLRPFALFSHAEASLGFREAEKREKGSASGDAFPCFQRSSRVYNNYFSYYRFFCFMESVRELLFRRERERERELCSLFCFPLHLV